MYRKYQVETEIQPSQEKRDAAAAEGKVALNYVGSSDGEIIFTFKPTENFPKYGGTLILKVPNWYTGVNPPPLSTFHSDIACEVPTGAEYIDEHDQCKDRADFSPSPNPNLRSQYKYSFSSFDSATTEIVFKCKNYRNPIYG